MYHASHSGAMMDAFVLNAMPINAAFQSALSKDVITEHPELWSEVRFRVLDDPFCNEMRIMSIITGTPVK